MRETFPRLWDRVTSRSLEQLELTEVKARSGHEMKKNLTWWDLIWFGIGAVIGAGIFVLTGLEAQTAAGPAVVISYVVSGISAMLSVFCYTEFAVEIPLQVRKCTPPFFLVATGDFAAFIAAGNILLEYVIGGAAVARSWTSYFATLLNHRPNDFRIHAPALAEEYNRLDPIAVVVVAVICVIAVVSTKGTSRFNYIASILHLLVIMFIIVAGLTKADTKNLSDFTPFGARGIFDASAVLFFAYLGFDAVSTMAEETKNPGRDIPIGLVGAMSITTVIYCVMALTLCLMVPYKEIDPDAPFSVAFSAVGMDWAKYIARYLTHIARAHMVPPWLAKVHGKTGTPINATAVMLLATAIIAFFTQLSILSNLLSISTLFIFMLVAVALLEDGWWPYVITISVWFLSTLGLQAMVPKAREPTVWGVPLVPWLPSASIAINIFLMGSIDGKSFERFAIWTAFLLLYYFFIGLHSSYDTAKAAAAAHTQQPLKKLEEGAARH
ncbi:unnamed protein product [Spirodela intermedia]|uniref:Cationic amino acid transporter C-terminal domain-containing protein n=1 Tax=Spirodela intermedia TaxID=51605 RepID=A0A7I8IJ28_SPIIN|nr:unnamed protein product [Spirodela intermedia]CAA6657905.1 unnamed protein product [Spirodela intermedia]